VRFVKKPQTRCSSCFSAIQPISSINLFNDEMRPNVFSKIWVYNCFAVPMSVICVSHNIECTIWLLYTYWKKGSDVLILFSAVKVCVGSREQLADPGSLGKLPLNWHVCVSPALSVGMLSTGVCTCRKDTAWDWRPRRWTAQQRVCHTVPEQCETAQR